MNQLQKIKHQLFEHRGKLRIGLHFDYKDEFVEIIRDCGGSYSITHKCWHIEDTMDNRRLLKKMFEGKANIDIILDERIAHSNVKKTTKKPELKERIQVLSSEYKEAIKDYTSFLKGRRYSLNSVSVYSSLATEFLLFIFPKELSELSNRDIERFNQEFIVKNNYSISTQRQFIGAVKILAECLESKLEVGKMVRPKKEKKLPTVLSKEEIIDLIRVTRNIKHRAALTMIYAAGLRISELLALKLNDIDIDRRIITIKNAKGRKDRNVVLSNSYLPLLANYISTYRPSVYYIEGGVGRAYSAVSIRAVLRRSCKAAKITKIVTPHTLRHSFATHLLENGTDVRYIQELLGHSRPETTMIYTHVTKKDLLNISSPLDIIAAQLTDGDKNNQNILLSRNLK